MFSLIDWYLTSLADFWSSAIRIGLPQILLVMLLICWMRKRRCGRGADGCCGDWCSWMSSCGRDDRGCCDHPECPRASKRCCCANANAHHAEEAADDA